MPGSPGATQDAIRPPEPRRSAEDELRLLDVLQAIHRHRVAFAVTAAAILLAGGATAWLTTPEYESALVVVPLDHHELIAGWFGSRQAAAIVVESLGERGQRVLLAGETSYEGTFAEAAAARLHEAVEVTVSRPSPVSPIESIAVSLQLPEPTMVRDALGAYLASLAVLRPQLEALTSERLFDRYYDGTNRDAALEQAETAARLQSYWMVFDMPTVPADASSPNVPLYMGVSAVLAVAAAFLVVYALETAAAWRAARPRPVSHEIVYDSDTAGGAASSDGAGAS